MLKITTRNKATIQFCFSNPHTIKARQEIQGITEKEIKELALALSEAYGNNWFKFFLALKASTLNKVLGQ